MAVPDPLTVDTITEYIARGHAFVKHAEGSDAAPSMNGVRAFMDKVDNQGRTLGPSLHISTPEDLQDYARRMISSPDTRGYVDPSTGSVSLYNKADNTRLVMSDLDANDMGTIFRYHDTGATFERQMKQAKQSSANPKQFISFDNAEDAGAAGRHVGNFIERVQKTAANSTGYRNSLMASPPGVAAHINGSQNLTTNGLSSDYRAFASRLDMADLARPGLTSGKGSVLEVNTAVAQNHRNYGRATHMAFLDEATNSVTEIKNGNVIVHTFDHLPASEQGRLAEQFFDRLREGATVHEGGLSGLTRSIQSTPSVTLPGGEISTIKSPSGLSRTTDALTSVREGTISVTSARGYASVDEGARIMLSLSTVEADLFNRIPDSIPASALNDLDPKVTALLGDLSESKALIDIADTGEEALQALDLFKKTAATIPTMPPATQKAFMDAIEVVGKSPIDEAADIARAAASGADVIDALSDTAKLARGAKMSRLGLNTSKLGIITTVVTTGLAVGATSYANATTLSISDQLHASGHLTDEAYAEYKDLMSEVGPMLTGQAADPTPLAIPGMVIVENIAMNRFQTFSDKHQLPQNIHEMLSPAMLPGLSLRASLSGGAFQGLPDTPEEASPELRDLVVARNEILTARADYMRVYDELKNPAKLEGAALVLDTIVRGATQPNMVDMSTPEGVLLGSDQAIRQLGEARVLFNNPRLVAAHEVEKSAMTKFANEFDKVLSDPRGAEALANALDPQELLEIVKATAQYQDRSTLDPMVTAYLDAETAYNNTEFYELMDQWSTSQKMGQAEEALRQNPNVLRTYLADVFVWKGPANGLGLNNKCYGVSNIEDNPNYKIIESAMKRIQSGEPLYKTEEEDLRRALNNPIGVEEQNIADAIKENFPTQAASYVEDKPEVIPASYDMGDPRFGSFAIP